MVMKAILQAMTEDQHDKRSWRSSCMVATLLLLTLALNVSTREQAALVRQAYNDSNDNILLLFTSAVVVGQILTSIVIISTESLRGDWPDKEAMSIIIFSHTGTLFLHDHLLSMGSAYSYLPISFLHPVLVLVTLWIVTSSTARPLTWTSMIIISTGCTFLSVKSSTIVSSDRTSLICILSMLSMILRNIVFRQLVGIEHVAFKLSRKRVMSALVITAVIFLIGIKCLTSPIWLFPSLCAIITCALSASLMYITTQVLKTYSVLFISLFCAWATLIEAIILTPKDHRPDLFTTVLALAVIIFGHYLFLKDHLEHAVDVNICSLTSVYPPNPANTHEQYTRIEFLLFAALVLGVIFFVFQPKVSQRDLNTLSYVGLDKIIRRLLMLEFKEEVHVVEEQGQVQLP